MTLLHDHPSIVMNWQFVFESSLLRFSQDISNLKLRGHRASHLLCLCIHEFILISHVWKYNAAEYPMNRGSQPFVNSLYCLSTVAIASREGTTRGLFIPKVILFFTVGNSGTVAGRSSRSRIVSNSFFVNSKLFVHAGILKTSFLSLVMDSGSKTWDRSRWSPAFSSDSALHLSPEIVHH